MLAESVSVSVERDFDGLPVTLMLEFDHRVEGGRNGQQHRRIGQNETVQRNHPVI